MAFLRTELVCTGDFGVSDPIKPNDLEPFNGSKRTAAQIAE